MAASEAGAIAACCGCLMIPLTIIITLAMFGVSVAEIVIGALHLHDCNIEKFIPIYLIVMGVVGIVFAASGGNSAKDLRDKSQGGNDADGSRGNACRCVTSIMGLFFIAWFICGHLWVFKNQDYTTEDSDAETYCDPLTYKFAFWSIIARWIVMGFYVLLICCMGCFAGICACCLGNKGYESA